MNQAFGQCQACDVFFLSPEEEELVVELAQQGSQEARRVLLLANLGMVAKKARVFSKHSPKVGLDTFQAAGTDKLMEMTERINRFEGRNGAQFSTFLNKGINNAMVDAGRKHGVFTKWFMPNYKERESALRNARADNNPFKEVMYSQLEDAFQAAVAKLPASDREVYLLFVEEGMCLRDIANKLDITYDAARRIYRRGRDSVRRDLRDFR